MTTDLTQVAFIDIETTGLDPDRHEVWEVAVITGTYAEVPPGDGPEPQDIVWQENVWQLSVDLSKADLIALNIGNYQERPFWPVTPVLTVSRNLMRLLWDKHLVGANPAFDQAFLTKLLKANGCLPTWRYRLIDVEALAMGYMLGRGFSVRHPENFDLGEIPWKWRSSALCEAMGVEKVDSHTAIGDARWARDVFMKVYA